MSSRILRSTGSQLRGARRWMIFLAVLCGIGGFVAGATLLVHHQTIGILVWGCAAVLAVLAATVASLAGKLAALYGANRS